MPINYVQLKSELQNDPAALGYPSLLLQGDHEGLAFALNLVRDTIDVERISVSSDEIIELMDATEYETLSQVQLLRLLILLQKDIFNIKRQNTKLLIGRIFPAGGPTRMRLTGLALRKGSRAEFLFGDGTRVVAADVARALVS